MTLSRSSVLFYNDFASGAEPEVGGPLSFARDSEKWTLGRDGLYHRARAGQWAYEWWDLTGKVSQPPSRRPGLTLEVASTPVNSDSVDIAAAGSAWVQGGTSPWTAVPSVFEGQGNVGWLLTPNGSDSSPHYRQEPGTFSGSLETYSTIYESLGADASDIRIWDVTAGAYIIGITYIWSTGAVGRNLGASGPLFGAEKLADAGPNGGEVVRLWITLDTASVSGHGRRIYVLPAGGGAAIPASKTAVVHHAQYETLVFPTSPIVYTGSATTRAPEFAIFPVHWPVQSFAWYMSFVEGGSIYGDLVDSQRGIWQIYTSAASGNSAMDVRGGSPAPGTYAWQHNDTGGTWHDATVNLGTVIGDYVELGGTFDTATGLMRHVGRKNGGAVVASSGGGASTVNGTWSDDRLWLPNVFGGQYGRESFHRLYFARLAGIASAHDGTADEALMDELADFHMRGP